MSETKVARINIAVEPSVYMLVMKVTHEEDLSLSQYLRGLILSDLTKKGLLTNDILIRMTQ